MGSFLLFSGDGKLFGNCYSTAGHLTLSLLQQESEVSVTELDTKAFFFTCKMMSLFFMYSKLSNI